MASATDAGPGGQGATCTCLALALIAAALFSSCAQPSRAADAGVDLDATPVPCTLLPQAGCPQACDLDPTKTSTAGTMCRGVVIAGTDDDTCTYFDDCAAGYFC